ncbi:hypothetical protein [Catellatospora sp. NPDC049609]|uniref:hypothetical protein n=1 Tax=Catellatospora sp. NPDC049609 TaxID=3155505 RepID=UPI00342066B8
MPINKSTFCDEGECDVCTTSWCECWCHDTPGPDDDWRERETTEDDHIMFG